MAAPKGNRFWEVRAKHGRDKKFLTPDDLWQCCCEYFEWVEENPLWEMRAWHSNGEVTQEPVAKMRAMTIDGLCIFLGISRTTWDNYRARKDYVDIVTRAEQIIRQQKFTGAAAELLNPNIIARDLGLSDKTDNTHSGPKGGPIEHKVEAKDVAEALEKLADRL